MSKLRITDVISLRTLQRIQDNFSDAAGIPVSLRDLNNELITDHSNKTKLWSTIEKNPEIKAIWNEKNLAALDESIQSGEVIIFERKAEVYTFIVPVTVNGRALAYFVGGLVRFTNPNIELCKKEAELMHISLDEMLDLYLQVPLVTRKRMEAAGNLLKTIANTISNLEIESTHAKAEAKAVMQNQENLKREIAHKNKLIYEHELKYQTLFQEISDGVYTVTMEGKLVDLNKAGAEMLGYEQNEIIGTMGIKHFIDPKQRQIYMSEIISKGYVKNFYIEYRHKSGHAIPVKESAVLMKDKQGNNIGIQGIFHELNHRRQQNLVDNKTQNVAPEQVIITDQNHQKPSI